MANKYTADADVTQLVHDGFGREIENWTCWEIIQSSWLQNWEIEKKTGSRLPTGEYTPPDTTQLDSWVASAYAMCIGQTGRVRWLWDGQEEQTTERASSVKSTVWLVGRTASQCQQITDPGVWWPTMLETGLQSSTRSRSKFKVKTAVLKFLKS